MKCLTCLFAMAWLVTTCCGSASAATRVTSPTDRKVLRPETANHTELEKEKRIYLNSVEQQTKRFERELIALKEKRSRQSPDRQMTHDFSDLEKTMEDQLTFIRRELPSLLTASGERWKEHQSRIEMSLAELNRLSQQEAE